MGERMVLQTERADRMKLVFHQVRLALGDRVFELDGTLTGPSTALFGPSGSGKTTLLELVAGLRRPSAGSIELDGRLLVDGARGIFVPARERAVGYIPQDLALFPHFSVRDNIFYGRRRGNIAPGELFRVLEIEHLLDRMPGSLSGGEKQRVAFARAVQSAPGLLLLDEPLASLDQELKDRILPCLQHICGEFGIPMIYVTHSIPEIVALCDEVLVLREGRWIGQGPPRDLFQRSDSVTYRLR